MRKCYVTWSKLKLNVRGNVVYESVVCVVCMYCVKITRNPNMEADWGTFSFKYCLRIAIHN